MYPTRIGRIEPMGSVVWFDADVIVDCDAQPLLAPEVFLSRLHAYMS
jgi:hypothetical protein